MTTNDKVFIKEIGRAYRFGLLTQAMIFISIVVITIIVLEFLPLTFEAKITALVVISTFLFPLIVIVATGAFFYIEVCKTYGSLLHFIYDGLVGLSVWLSFAFYKAAQWRDTK